MSVKVRQSGDLRWVLLHLLPRPPVPQGDVPDRGGEADGRGVAGETQEDQAGEGGGAGREESLVPSVRLSDDMSRLSSGRTHYSHTTTVSSK